MRRIVIVAPDLLAYEATRQNLPTLAAMVELGSVFKIAAPPRVETPEALWLGVDPTIGQLRQGPLTVSALGADPPERSTHFHLTPMSFDGNVVTELGFVIPEEECRALMEAAKKLNTATLTIVNGTDRDHGLVWEGLGDMATKAPLDAAGKPLKDVLPEGDADIQLRRFIDDSANLLNDLPFNERRMDEGLPPINILWPWGHGVRVAVPNLALRRGEPAEVFSASLRMAGLTRLAGYRHGDRTAFGQGLNTKFEAISRMALRTVASVCVVDGPAALAAAHKQEELHWLVHEMDEKLLKPLFEDALKISTRATLLAPSAEGGLGLRFETGNRNSNSTPFDERALEEKTLQTVDLWSAVERGIVS